MSGFILGQKQDQSQRFTEEGDRIPVTMVKTSPCYLISIMEPAKHGYSALKLGFGTAKNVKKPQVGETKKAGIEAPLHFLKEVRLEKTKTEIVEQDGKKALKIGEAVIFPGQELKASVVFQIGDMVNVTGTSKGKGFAGVVKRHGFHGGPKTHGQSDRHRAPGSIGTGTTPGRVLRGKKMAGRMGQERITVTNLEVVEATETHLLLKGLIPGATKGLVEVSPSK